MTTHYEGCYDSGPRHYECALLEVKRLQEVNTKRDIISASVELRRLHQCLRNVYEVWAGSEGIPAPTVASDAYLLSLIEQMRDAAKEGLR